MFTLIKNGFRTLTQQVKTLDAALLKWKLLTYRNESAHNVKTNNSPPRSDKTSLSVAMNAIWAQSKLIFTPSCGSDENRKFIRLNSNIICYVHVKILFKTYSMESWCYDQLCYLN